MIITQNWYSLDEALPPLDEIKEGYINHSIPVAIVLKTGGIHKAIRYYVEEGPSNWGILDEIREEDEIGDNEIAGWSKIPSF